MASGGLQCTDDGAIRVLTIHRPDKRNALDMALCRALVQALQVADEDSAVAAVVLTAQGPIFSAGADLSEAAAVTSAEAAEDRRALYMALLRAMPAMRKPVISAVAGRAIGLGAAVALMADLVVCCEEATFEFPELRHAMVPGLMAAPLQRVLGPRVVFELLVACRPLSGSRAYDLGASNLLVAQAQVVDEALQLARSVAAFDAAAIEHTKQLLKSSNMMVFDEALKAGVQAGLMFKSGKK